MKNIKQSHILQRFNSVITDETQRAHVMSLAVYVVFAAIAAVMSVVNIVSGKTVLLIATLVFMALCLADFAIGRWAKRGDNIASSLFVVEVGILFTFFIVTGGTDNFSIVWLLLLPTVGLFFFGRVRGTILSAVILVIMLLCFYHPGLEGICVDYGKTFEARFPIVYISCFLVSYLLEYIRYTLADELNKLREKYEALYNHDALTGILNRYNAEEAFARSCATSQATAGIVMFDIDLFKKLNDTYGHQFGDEVLIELVAVVKSIIPADASFHRWGGEEFLLMFSDGQDARRCAEEIRRSVEAHVFSHNGKTAHATVSVGLVVFDRERNRGLEYAVRYADENLYQAKENGRNQLVCSEL